MSDDILGSSGEGAVKLLSSKQRMVAALVLLLLALYVLRPGASPLKARIISSISSAIGRSVDIGSVHLRLLPRPGFDLENLVVYDDPAFGAEPMLRASEVIAALRLTSLLRGRLEVARLELTEPSLNLVHGESGRWNVEALLERTAHTPLAPTAKAKSEPRPGFPYIQATSARINFKNGNEKKPFALTNADFSLWQESENAWGVRLKAQTFRSDMNLNDTGMLQVSGKWQRAEKLRDTPLEFTMEWSRAQLGQFTKLLSGNDKGWRGALQLDVNLTGTPSKLQVAGDASIQDFRRYDITSGEALRLAAHCDGQYSSVDHELHELACSAPVGNGVITLKGDAGVPGSHQYALVLAADDVPAGAVAALAQRAKKNLPEDLAANGTLNGSLSIAETAGSQLRLQGRGEISEFRLASASNKIEVGPGTVPFAVNAAGLFKDRALRRLSKNAPRIPLPNGPRVEFGPFAVSLARGADSAVRGWISRSGYDIETTGEVEFGRALRVARMLGLPAMQTNVEGTAQVDLQIAGSWAGQSGGNASGFLGPQVTGNAKLRNVRVTLRGTGAPIEVASADMQLSPEGVRVVKMNAAAANTVWSGSLELPRGCGTPAACPIHFNLNANRIALRELSDWASPHAKERPWYRVLGTSTPAGPSFLGSLRASGHITADRFQVQALAATHVSANVSVDAGKLRVSDLKADLLSGTHRGEWQANFTTKPAVCSGSGTLTGISLARLADMMKDQWIEGAANASYEVKGSITTDYWQSAEGTLQFDVQDGGLPHISLGEDEGAIKISRLSGRARLESGAIEFKNVALDSTDGRFELSGTASLTRDLDLKLSRMPHGATGSAYAITGTLAEPRVVPSANPETQARLKP